MKKILSSICVLLLLGGVAAASTAPHASSIAVGTLEEAMQQQQAQHQLHTRLMLQRVETGIKSPIVVELDDTMQKALIEETSWPLRIGVVAPVNTKVSLDISSPQAITDKAMVLPIGAVRRVGHGMVWTAALSSYGATGIRLHLTGLDLPKGAELAIFNERGEAFAYTGKGPFNDGELWTNAVTGGVAYLQLSGADLSKVAFTIDELGYLGDRWVIGAHAGLTKSFCSYNASCIENAGCGIDPPAADSTNAVAHMQYVKQPYIYACSGGLLANDASRAYFLTANHCISKDSEAETLEAYFFYEIGCNDPCPAAWSTPSTPRTLGATVAATNKTGDYSLLELAEPAPAGTVMLGWDATAIAFSDGVDLYRISHPSTAPQAYSTHTVDTSYGTCSSWPRGSWIYSRDTYGATEGGSSGSPVVNDNGEVVGQLSGGCGTNINDVCDWQSNATVDGAFASYYSEIAALLSGGCTPEPEICDDGIDNDCDGLVDDDDPDCDPCLPRGAACTSNDECCSGRCHPRRYTCR